MKKTIAIFTLFILLAGCVSLPSFGTGEKEFSLTGIDGNLQQQLPRTQKSSFGTLKLVGVALQPGVDEKGLEVLAKFVLVSYEIPEGIEGVVGYTARLRYNPQVRALQLTQLQPKQLSFGNSSLEEYVSASARRGIPRAVATMLQGLKLQSMPDGFSAHRVSAFSVKNDKLFVDFD